MAKKAMTIYNLRETYHEFGTYDFKIVLSPDVFLNSHGSNLRVVDSDRKPMKHQVDLWGRKVNCRFTIDDSVSDGVMMIDLDALDKQGKSVHERFTCWVVKPG